MPASSPPLTIPFNRPFTAGREFEHIQMALANGNIGADGVFTQACGEWLKQRLGVPEVLLTSSCTTALEIAVTALGIRPGDEVILPSFTYVSTANAVIRRGATPVWVDIRPDTLNLDESLVIKAVTSKTRAIIPVHYGGSPAAMASIMDTANGLGLAVVEDAAAAMGATVGGTPVGAIGNAGCFSFHETKNLGCGQGGAICLRDPSLVAAARIYRDRGTNRSELRAGKVDRYTWVGEGSACSLSELSAAWLWGQLEQFDAIATRREVQHRRYSQGLQPLMDEGFFRVPTTGPSAMANHHTFAIILPSHDQRQGLAHWLRQRGILAVSHYEPLHSSPMGRSLAQLVPELPVTDTVSRCLLRLPLYHDLEEASQMRIMEEVHSFFGVPISPTPLKTTD